MPGEESESSQEESEYPRPALDDGWEDKGNLEYLAFTYEEEMDSYTQEVVGNRGEGCKVGCYYLLKYTEKLLSWCMRSLFISVIYARMRFTLPRRIG